MGRIFSWQEVEKKRVPKLQDFENVGTVLRERLANHPGIVAALLCGSVVRGDHNVRSDVDCLVLYKREERSAVMTLLQELLFVANKLFVPVEMIPLDTELAATPHHHLYSTFLEHLALSAKQGGVIQANPMLLIHPNRTSFVEDTRSYLIHKMRKLEKGLATIPFYSEDELLFFLEKVLALPVYAARKMIRSFGLPLETDSKEAVIRTYPGLGLEAANRTLVAATNLDRNYQETLERHLKKPEEGVYQAVINNLQIIVPDVLDFARDNLMSLTDLKS